MAAQKHQREIAIAATRIEELSVEVDLVAYLELTIAVRKEFSASTIWQLEL